MNSTIITQGMIFSLVAMAVYITSRVINKDDLSVEGSFGLGGALTAVMLEHHMGAYVTVGSTLMVGAMAGTATGLLYTRLKMNHLMAGLTTTTACFSLSLAMASANKIVQTKNTIFSPLPWIKVDLAELLVVFAIATATLAALRLLLRSEVGLLLRTTGDNPGLLLHMSKSAGNYYVLGFALANALTALAGSLFVQWSGFFSITGNVGTLITGLASLMIAELFSKKLGFIILVSALGYQLMLAFTMAIGISPIWNNLIKAAIMIILVVLSKHLKSNARGARHA
jgi:putative tryptophan/tyrosine transport system permease protein